MNDLVGPTIEIEKSGNRVYPMVYLNPNFKHLTNIELKVMSVKCDNHAARLRTKLDATMSMN